MSEFAIYPSLKNKKVLITGGASGIGEITVKAFAEQGADVAFLDRDAGGSKAVSEACGARYAICDLRDIPAMQTAIAELGPFDVLVNNAARDDRHDWRDVTPDYWDERMETNLRHMFFAIQSVAPGMVEAGAGSIINVGSNSWWETKGGFPAYATAKSAVHGLTRTMARELGRDRIRVNAIVPGWIMTDRQKELWATDEGLEMQKQVQCLPDLIDPVYVARMCVFLAADDSAMCTAANFMVTGGSM